MLANQGSLKATKSYS